MSTITDLPVELFLDNLLPLLPLPALANLASTNKFFASLLADDTFWKRKCQSDFNFSGAGTARTSGWKFIYSGLSKPRVYVWGNKQNGRLGLSQIPKTPLRDVSYPTQLRVQEARIVSLAAAGTSFQALDSEGQIYVWGTLNGSAAALKSDGFSEPSKRADSPLRLQLPVSIRTVSCGRFHAASLDAHGYIWNFTSWGRPFRMTSPRVRGSEAVPIQVECGWAFSSALGRSGDVYVWWPLDGEIGAAVRRKNQQMDADVDNRDFNKGRANDNDVIECATWDLDMDPIVLPPLPSLPKIWPNEDDELNGGGIPIIIQIAAYDSALVALTDQGHVLKFGSLGNESVAVAGVWEYLPAFSELRSIRMHQAFQPGGSLEAPKALRITHVSAHFKHFIAYSTGEEATVLIGGTETPLDAPQIIPELQRRDVISVVLGDYHYAALTADGKLLTWGAYSNGALGLGDPTELGVGRPGGFATEDERIRALERGRGNPPAVNVPTEVRFDHKRKTRKDRFCISATASGWHTGALVIDLEKDQDGGESEYEEEKKDLYRDLEPHMPHRRFDPIDPNMAPFRGGLPHFRIGFAGRGMNRGALPGLGRGRGGEAPGPY